MHNRTTPTFAALVVASAAAMAGYGARDGDANATAARTFRPATDPARAYADCMRRNGVAGFPDPVDGRIELRPGGGVDPSSPAFRDATRACERTAAVGGSAAAAGAAAAANAGGGLPSFRRWLAREARAGRFAGTVLVTNKGRPLVSASYGRAEERRNDPNTRATLFNIGSIGKTFTAVAVAQLVEQGRLSWSDPVAKYVAGLPEGITIAQLLTHTSGLGDVFARWRPRAAKLDVSELLDRVRSEPLQFAPGTGQAYSNSGYVVLGAVLDAITGRDYYEYIREHVFRPAGMRHTGWHALDQLPHMAHGYVTASGRLRDTRGAGGWGNPSGGAWSTADDLTRFARALLGHRLLGAAMTDTIFEGRVPKPAGGSIGYGFEHDRRGGLRVVGHGGGAPGIEAQLRIYPSRRTVAVVLANRDAAARPVAQRITAALARSTR
jgi:CubicO group peptidase (beta-lactamase class C family)